MPLITWDNKFSVGINEIDIQHQKLFQLLNNLYDAMREGAGRKKLELTLQELVEYTDYHFKTEEALFEKYAYSEKTEHLKEHNELRGKVIDFGNKFIQGNGNITIELMNFLKDWINRHILSVDKKYSSFLSSKMN